jgi:hypothetical protein
MKMIFDKENDLDGSSSLASQRHRLGEKPLHPLILPPTAAKMDSKAEAEYSRFLHDTINAASHGLFEIANNDPLIYPLQTWLHALAPGPTFHSLQMKGAVMNVLFPFHSQELMVLLCCYIEGVYVYEQLKILAVLDDLVVLITGTTLAFGVYKKLRHPSSSTSTTASPQI